jgi:hypothetical protein
MSDVTAVYRVHECAAREPIPCPGGDIVPRLFRLVPDEGRIQPIEGAIEVYAGAVHADLAWRPGQRVQVRIAPVEDQA